MTTADHVLHLVAVALTAALIAWLAAFAAYAPVCYADEAWVPVAHGAPLEGAKKDVGGVVRACAPMGEVAP